MEAALPSASTVEGEAATVEVASTTLGVVKLTVGVWPAPFRVTESVVSVAV